MEHHTKTTEADRAAYYAHHQKNEIGAANTTPGRDVNFMGGVKHVLGTYRYTVVAITMFWTFQSIILGSITKPVPQVFALLALLVVLRAVIFLGHLFGKVPKTDAGIFDGIPRVFYWPLSKHFIAWIFPYYLKYVILFFGVFLTGAAIKWAIPVLLGPSMGAQ